MTIADERVKRGLSPGEWGLLTVAVLAALAWALAVRFALPGTAPYSVLLSLVIGFLISYPVMRNHGQGHVPPPGLVGRAFAPIIEPISRRSNFLGYCVFLILVAILGIGMMWLLRALFL